MLRLLAALLFCLFSLNAVLYASTDIHAQANERLQYLLNIDRLEYYTQSLADFLDGKKSSDVVQALRDLAPEDFITAKPTAQGLNSPAEWDKYIYNALTRKHPHLQITPADLKWDYNFIKNKMLERFKIRNYVQESLLYPNNSKVETVSQRSVPKITGQKVLLDTDRYIGEKTTRAIIWDAIAHDRGFAFFVGTQLDFQEQIAKTGLRIVSEVLPMARNYNKIFLTFDPKTMKYSYAINLISGNDRIVHLAAQLRLVRFQGKGFFDAGEDKVKIYGSPKEFHQRQEHILTDLFARLPKADKIVIGQKGAIEKMIEMAGQVDAITSSGDDILSRTDLPKGIKLHTKKSSTFSNLTKTASGLKSFDLGEDLSSRNYRQFTSEQASHEFSDVLFTDKSGNIQRWRFFSAVWGDEIIPIARALKNTGHSDVVYIGTAGAIANKGLKVGDVVAGDQVLTHSGKTLKFSSGTLVQNARAYTIGQVHTPFDETDTWLANKTQNMDVVEVETGYLRESLGENAKLEAYFLVSDVVGSEHETLAHAAQSASKRKKGQLRLLENLFVQNGILAPIPNFEVIPKNSALKNTFEKLKSLRQSREEFSLLQIAHKAVREGKTSDADLTVLLKSQPNFTRSEMSTALMTLGGFLSEVQSVLGTSEVQIFSEDLSTGTFNPKVKNVLKLASYPKANTEDQLAARMGKEKWARFKAALSQYFDLRIVEISSEELKSGRSFKVSSAESFVRDYEKRTLKPAGFTSEVDGAGKFRLRSVPGIDRGIRCEMIFL